MNELSRFFGDTCETRLYRSDNRFIIELYRDNKLMESRTLPMPRGLQSAEDYADDWATGEIQ